MTVKDGHFMLRERQAQEVINNTIDIFFSSLAEDAKEKAIGIIYPAEEMMALSV